LLILEVAIGTPVQLEHFAVKVKLITIGLEEIRVLHNRFDYLRKEERIFIVEKVKTQR
jgi:hypothetical protein